MEKPAENVGSAITLKRLTAEDSDFLFSWANDPAVIEGSFMRTEAISKEEHVRWFKDKLADPSCYLFIVYDQDGRRVGQIRFDLLDQNKSESIVSLGIAPEFRRMGYASAAIDAGSLRMFAETEVTLIHAYIRPFNVGSKKAFIAAGFDDHGVQKYSGTDAIYVTRKKSNPKS